MDLSCCRSNLWPLIFFIFTHTYTHTHEQIKVLTHKWALSTLWQTKHPNMGGHIIYCFTHKKCAGLAIATDAESRFDITYGCGRDMGPSGADHQWETCSFGGGNEDEINYNNGLWLHNFVDIKTIWLYTLHDWLIPYVNWVVRTILWNE